MVGDTRGTGGGGYAMRPPPHRNPLNLYNSAVTVINVRGVQFRPVMGATASGGWKTWDGKIVPRDVIVSFLGEDLVKDLEDLD